MLRMVTPSAEMKLSETEIKDLVRSEVIDRVKGLTDHIALHPYWLAKPLQGIEEELQHRLGKWMRRFDGYLVAFSDIRRDSLLPCTIHIDQPWIHVDVKGKFCVFRPKVGQVLTGVVKKLGSAAAICVTMNYFSVTVLPGSDFDIDDWTIDDTLLEFRVTEYQRRGKGPQLKAQSQRVLKNTV